MASIRSKEVSRLLEAHVRAVRAKEHRRGSAFPVALAAAVMAGAAIFGGLTLVSRTSPVNVSLSGVSFESAANGAIELLSNSVGGSAFKTSDLPSDQLSVSAPAPAAPAPPPAAPTPVPVDLATLTGDPYSAVKAIEAWRAAGFTVTQQPLGHDGFNAIAGRAAGLRLEGHGSLLNIALIVYDDSKAVGGDWQTSSGQKPQLRPERALPAFQTVWWNRNMVVGVLDQTGGSQRALDAFLGIK